MKLCQHLLMQFHCSFWLGKGKVPRWRGDTKKDGGKKGLDLWVFWWLYRTALPGWSTVELPQLEGSGWDPVKTRRRNNIQITLRMRRECDMKL